jgi:exonuclease III
MNATGTYAQKKGYSGTAVFSKRSPYRLNWHWYRTFDQEGAVSPSSLTIFSSLPLPPNSQADSP